MNKKIIFLVACAVIVGSGLAPSLARAIMPSLVINPIALPSATVGQPYTASISFTQSFNNSVFEQFTGLPAGIGMPLLNTTNVTQSGTVLMPNATQYITLSGTPSQAGTYNATLTLTNNDINLVVSQSFTLTVLPQVNPPALTNLSPASGPAGTTVTATGTGFLAANNVNYTGAGYGSGTITNVTNTSATSLQFQVPAFLPIGSYTFAVVNSNGLSSYVPFTVIAAPAPITPPSSMQHNVGTNVLGPDGTVYFITQDGHRSPYTSAGAFLSYGFNSWAGVQTANSSDLALPLSNYTPSGSMSTTTYFIPPRNGALINDKGTVYLITNGLRIGFASAAAFTGLGYSFSNVKAGDTSFMVALAPINSSAMAHPDGTLVNDNGTVYLMKNGNKLGFPTVDIFYSWGYSFAEVVPANSYDHAASSGGTVSTRLSNQLSL